jgi:hypothetical protein
MSTVTVGRRRGGVVCRRANVCSLLLGLSSSYVHFAGMKLPRRRGKRWSVDVYSCSTGERGGKLRDKVVNTRRGHHREIWLLWPRRPPLSRLCTSLDSSRALHLRESRLKDRGMGSRGTHSGHFRRER